MKYTTLNVAALLTALLLTASVSSAQTTSSPLGLFEGQSEIGKISTPSTVSYDAHRGAYTITSSGADVWGTADDFHFVWKKVSGDMSLTANVMFSEKNEQQPRRKAMLMFRQSLDPDSAYADAAFHGYGMTALQYRHVRAGPTQDEEINTTSIDKMRLVKRGDTVTLFVSIAGEPLHPVGASVRVPMTGDYYIGLGVCAHSATGSEKAVFSNVEIKPLAPPAGADAVLFSSLRTIPTNEGSRRGVIAYAMQGRMEAPNWSKDGTTLLFTQDGKIMSVGATGGTPKALDIGAATRCSGSHGFSHDGKWLVISCAMPDKPEARVYLVPAGGGTPRLVTEKPNSYWHGWSPDGKTIFFVHPLNGSFNIYAIPVEGGEEKAITTGNGVNDDPDCSPDGQWVYFHSDRSGSVQIWRMHPDGSGAEPVTADEMMNRTPHVSPDGKLLVMLSYSKDVTGRLVNRPVMLRVMSLETKKIWTIAEFTGGSGTINVPSWAPDSQHLAFMSYQDLPAEDAR